MITLNEISDTEKAFCWFETSDTTSLTGVTSISAPITATPGGTIVKATPTFDRTRADDLLLDSDVTITPSAGRGDKLLYLTMRLHNID